MVISVRVPESGDGFTSPVMTECGMFVMGCLHYFMSVSTGLWCVHVLSRRGIYMFAILCNVKLCVLMVEVISVAVNVMLCLMSPSPAV